MPDIATRADLEMLLRDFYGRAFVDPLLGHVFVDVVQMDLERHLPVIVGFWQKVLFNVGTYNGRPMHVHQRLHQAVPLTDAHFTRWVALWRNALDAHFAGPVTEQAAAHATRIAAAFAKKLPAALPERRGLPLLT